MTTCPVCEQPLLDLRGAGFSAAGLLRDRQCYMFIDGHVTCCAEPTANVRCLKTPPCPNCTPLH